MEKERNVDYKAFYLVDTCFFSPLDGKYTIEEYFMIPCLNTVRNSELGCSSFALGFDFKGVEERGLDSSEQTRQSFVNMSIASLKAKTFLAWMVCATRQYARLSNIAFGRQMKGGPSIHILLEDLDESKLQCFNLNTSAKEGEYVTLKRPSLEEASTSQTHLTGTFKLPSDFPSLSKKMFSLRRKEKEQFLNACFSYQFALENWSSYPTISILALVSAVESMIAETYTSKYCKDAKRNCRLKTNLMKRFRMFFEQTLTYPLPLDLKRFLNAVYSRRSLFVHKALLGQTGGIRGVFGQHFGDGLDSDMKLMSELRDLERLVNAGLIQWLVRV